MYSDYIIVNDIVSCLLYINDISRVIMATLPQKARDDMISRRLDCCVHIATYSDIKLLHLRQASATADEAH